MTKLSKEEHPGIDYDSADSSFSNDEKEEEEEIIGSSGTLITFINEFV